MTKAAPIQTSFNGGELSPLLGGRTDLAVYAIGVEEMLNVVPTIQGAAVKRPGTRHKAIARTAAGAGRLLNFQFNVLQTYVIEATNQRFRFFTNGGQVESAPGVPYEVVTPYLEAELEALQFYQSNDVQFLAHIARPFAQLRRTSATTFVHENLELTNGPFKKLNADNSITVGASAATGSITLTASAGIFAAGHVGALFRLEAVDFAATPAWEPGIEVTVNSLRRSEGKVYRATTLPASGSKRTGTITPIHTEGFAWDGMSTGIDINAKPAGGVQWEYLHDAYGIAKITAYTSPTQVTATVLRRFPDGLLTTPSARWSHALFSAVEGWPAAVAVWNERLILARGTTIAGGVVGDLLNFADRDPTGIIAPDLAFVYTLPVANPIRWLVADRELLVGTTRGEVAIGPLNRAAAPGPGNLQAPPQSFHGSSVARPIQALSATLFVQRGGRKIREAGFDFNVDRYVAPDMTTRSEHITLSGVRELAYQQEPLGIVWAGRRDGVLAGLTFSDEQAVRGWSRHVLGGFSDDAATAPAKVESVTTIPDPTGTYDELWLMVRRRIGGADVRHIEMLAPFRQLGDPLKDAFFVDGGATYAGAPATTIGGLEYLAGQTVSVLADGSVHPDRVVSGAGTIALQRAASTVHVGLPYLARVVTMRLEAGGGDGTAQGKIKKIVKLVARLLETLGIRIGVPGGSIDDVETRTSADDMDAPPPAFSGDHKMDYPGSFELDGRIVTESYQPLPMTLLALMPQVDTRDAVR